MEGWE